MQLLCSAKWQTVILPAEREENMDLFDFMREETKKSESPLASRMRPERLDEVVGQKHILGEGSLQGDQG